MLAWFLSTRLGRLISGSLAALAAFAGVYALGRREGAQRAENEALKDNAERQEKGRKAVSDGRRSGKSPADRVRDNDAKW